MFFFFFIILFIIHITREKDLRVYTFRAYTLADSPFAWRIRVRECSTQRTKDEAVSNFSFVSTKNTIARLH